MGPHAAHPARLLVPLGLPSPSPRALTRLIPGMRRVTVSSRVDGRPGDWLVENAESVAVVSAEGKLIDFGAGGGRDDYPRLTPPSSSAYTLPTSRSPAFGLEGDGAHVLHVVRRVLEKPLLLHEVHVTRPLRQGDWILAVACGERPMTYLHRSRARPSAFTNPIWVE